jgi:hypothetical protein
MQNWLKPGPHYTKYFDRVCFAASDWGKMQTRLTLFSHFAINNVVLYNSLFTVEAIFQRDRQITKEVE